MEASSSSSSSSLTFTRYFYFFEFLLQGAYENLIMSILKISILFAPELNPATSSRREFGRGPGWAIPGFVKLRGDPFKTKYLSSRLCFATTANGGGFRKELKGLGVGVGGGDAVIIVDHGSRRNESNLMLNEFVVMFREKTKYPIVEPAHMDIPSLTAEAAKDHPGVSYVITAPLGLHELLVDVVNDRINYCLSHVAGEEDECSLDLRKLAIAVSKPHCSTIGA
ncbi:Sirohydrochlorin ferrochelatase, chloroplastic [Sesamum angolense]|uniref:Sirohydrochlorin ferrochelatase, chloroplastic n=1 Tax=Sesamum angolense TaxID=2727404 RepID=A0AAE1WGM6_9LAMI|nr:Sirohydrochlorin ferrochelatase, chloroplastic [Sesamum angolense]